VLGLTWQANRGTGAYLNGDLLASCNRPLLSRELVVVDNYPEAKGVSRDLLEWLGNATYRESGSIGLKAALVASGQADIFTKDVVVRDWDVAPALALAGEVGGFASRVTGQDYLFSGPYDKFDGIILARDKGLGDLVTAWFAERSPSG
jgi:fructose-1,6-bisphosphatase/inositol monophosphatase family enzyme